MKEFIQKFTDSEIIDFKNVIEVNKECYLISPELKKIQFRINKKPSYAGIYLGKGDKPGLFLLQMLARHSESKVWLDEKGEWLFICQRDIFGSSIVKSGQKYVIDSWVLVLNKYNECLGYGKVVGEIGSPKIAIKRIFDIGDFLRREREIAGSERKKIMRKERKK